MVETQVYAGRCSCGRELEMRIVDVREIKDDPKSKIIAWIIYGFCKKCNVVHFEGLFTQEEQPVLDRDYIIDFKIQIDDGKEGKKCL